jgi:hypothetical protein
MPWPTWANGSACRSSSSGPTATTRWREARPRSRAAPSGRPGRCAIGCATRCRPIRRPIRARRAARRKARNDCQDAATTREESRECWRAGQPRDSSLVVVVPRDTLSLLSSETLGPPVLEMGDLITESELRGVADAIRQMPGVPRQDRIELPSELNAVLRNARYNRVEGLSLGLSGSAQRGRLTADALGPDRAGGRRAERRARTGPGRRAQSVPPGRIPPAGRGESRHQALRHRQQRLGRDRPAATTATTSAASASSSPGRTSRPDGGAGGSTESARRRRRSRPRSACPTSSIRSGPSGPMSWRTGPNSSAPR